MGLQIDICASESTAITGTIYTGEIKPATRIQSPPKPAMTVRSTVRQHLSGRSVTIYEVDPQPRVIKPAVKMAAAAPLNENSPESTEEVEAQPIQFIFVSATVYDEGQTRLIPIK